MNFFNTSIETDFSAQSSVLRELQLRADSHTIELLVVGALARDLMIRGVTGAAPNRTTADIDVAVSVASWRELRELTKGAWNQEELRTLSGSLTLPWTSFPSMVSRMRTGRSPGRTIIALTCSDSMKR